MLKEDIIVDVQHIQDTVVTVCYSENRIISEIP